MDVIEEQTVVALLTSATTYGSKITSILNCCETVAIQKSSLLKPAANAFNVSLSTLNQALALVKDDSDLSSRNLINNNGIRYIGLLAKQHVIASIKFDMLVKLGCTTGKQRKASRKLKNREFERLDDPEVDLSKYKLEDVFSLENIESCDLSSVHSEVSGCVDRIRKLQKYLFLVVQVIGTRALEKQM